MTVRNMSVFACYKIYDALHIYSLANMCCFLSICNVLPGLRKKSFLPLNSSTNLLVANQHIHVQSENMVAWIKWPFCPPTLASVLAKRCTRNGLLSGNLW